MKIFLLFTISLMTLIQSVYAGPIIYVCTFDSFSTKQGNQKVKEEFKISFLVDETNEQYYIIGNNGSEKVKYIPHYQAGIAFIEITQSGNVITTAIDKEMNSVHSRNLSLAGILAPSQYYGSCVIK